MVATRAVRPSLDRLPGHWPSTRSTQGADLDAPVPIGTIDRDATVVMAFGENAALPFKQQAVRGHTLTRRHWLWSSALTSIGAMLSGGLAPCGSTAAAHTAATTSAALDVLTMVRR